jgi:hypothetical protein
VNPAARPDPTSPDAKARGKRNIAIALGLVGFALLLFVVTLVRMKGNVLDAGLF